MKATRVTVTTTPTRLTTADDTVPYPERRAAAKVLIHNPSGLVNVYLGGSDVLSSNGYVLPSGATVTFDLAPSEEAYAITESGSQTVHVLHLGVA